MWLYCSFEVSSPGGGGRTRTQPLAVLVLLLETGSALTSGRCGQGAKILLFDYCGEACSRQSSPRPRKANGGGL